jgi:hypothetical protein
MIAVVLALAVSGYVVVRGLADEDEFLPALCLGVPLAWGLYITALNLELRAGLPFGLAAALAVAVIVAAAVTGALRLARRHAPRARFDRLDLALVLLGAFPASALVLLYHFLGADGDDFIHYPLVALFRKGYFPHFNPYFPDVPLHGHYGRDLGLAGLTSFGGIGIGTAMAIEAWILHLATLGNVYFLARRAGGGRMGGAAAAYLVFFGVNAGFSDWLVRSGMAEVMGNNNPVAYAFLFAILDLAARIAKGATGPVVLLAGSLLGGFDIVYETHFIFTVGGLFVLAVLLAFSRPAAARRVATATAIGLALMIPAGGLTSRLVASKLRPTTSTTEKDGAHAWARAGMQQAVEVRFPKTPFLSLTHARDGSAVPLFSFRFLRGQGLAIWLFPLTFLALAVLRNEIGLACAAIGAASLLIPATVDFGRFNGENFRLIFFAGVMFAACLGIALGSAAEELAARRPHWRHGGWRFVAPMVVAALVWHEGGRTYQIWRTAQQLALQFPALFRLREIERLQQYCPGYARSDEEATHFLAATGRRGEVMMTNFVPPERPRDLLNDAMVIMTESQMPMVGFNARLPRATGGIQGSVEGWSGRAIAFWRTGDAELLRDLNPSWLYVVPRWLPAQSQAALTSSPAVREMFRATDGERVVYRVDLAQLPPRPKPDSRRLQGLAMTAAEGLRDVGREEFRMVTLRLANEGSEAVREPAFLFYRLFDRIAGSPYDDADSVGAVQALDLPPGGEQAVAVPFVAPYHDGPHDVTFFVATAQGDRRIGSATVEVGTPPAANDVASAR